MTGARDGSLEKVLWHAEAQAGTVARAAIGIDRAAMPDGFQGVYGQFDNLAPWLAFHVGDQADAAGIAFVFRTVEARRFEKFQPLAVPGFRPV